MSTDQGGLLPLFHEKPKADDSSEARLTREKNEEYIANIPLTTVPSNLSTGVRKEGQKTSQPELVRQSIDEGQKLEKRHHGRRRLTAESQNDPKELNPLGKIYERLLNASIITRYLVYVVPVSLVLSIPILVGAFGPGKKATIGGVKIEWFFLWIQVVWVSLWASKLVTKALPYIYQALAGAISSGVRKYATVLRDLEIPISLVGWTVTSLTTFTPMMTRNPDNVRTGDSRIKPWQVRMNSVLAACVVSSLVYLGEKLFVQLVSVDYHRKQFQKRIQENKNQTRLIVRMYEVSRNLFPDNGVFYKEDCIIYQGIAGSALSPMLAQEGNTAAAQVHHFISSINAVGNKVTSAFGNVAQEVVGNKSLFNANAANSIVTEALQRRSSAEALARRIWMSFVAEDHDALYKGDILEVMGAGNEDLALECFNMLDRDGNGDVSLEEMITQVLFIRKEKDDVRKSVHNIDHAIRVLDSVLGTVVFIVVVFIFVAFNLTSFTTMLAAAGTLLLSLSFVFSVTAQELLGSCIFLFVKHPYDVGDRVEIDNEKYSVEEMSLLYTVFRKTQNNKATQIPNNVLNTKAIDNITRSGPMKEIVEVSINFDTSFDDINALRQEMLDFVKNNGRDYQPDFDIEVFGVKNLNQLDLKIEIRHKSNWANERLALERRNKFLRALALACKKIPIYSPSGGSASLGEAAKPTYTVAISHELAQQKMVEAERDKLQKRYDYKPDGQSDNSNPGKRGSIRSNISQGSRQDEIEEIQSTSAGRAISGKRKAAQGSGTRSGSSSHPHNGQHLRAEAALQTTSQNLQARGLYETAAAEATAQLGIQHN